MCAVPLSELEYAWIVVLQSEGGTHLESDGCAGICVAGAVREREGVRRGEARPYHSITTAA